jgi:hypothetical protein
MAVPVAVALVAAAAVAVRRVSKPSSFHELNSSAGLKTPALLFFQGGKDSAS